MSETKRIPSDQLTRYFDAFSKKFLMSDSVQSADVEVVGTDLGDQPLHTRTRWSWSSRRAIIAPTSRARCGRWRRRTGSSAASRSFARMARARS